MASTVLTDFSHTAERLTDRINEALAAAVEPGAGCPATLAEAIRYSLLAPGKRLRPILVLLAAEACGSHVEDAMPGACAVEMVHAYSLVHDDLPAMDDDDLRRGRPTCHRAFDEATAILAGDALLTLAFETLATRLPDPAIAAECVQILARAAGAAGMVGGQADDLDAARAETLREQFERGETEACLATLESIHRRKTGAMFCASLELGAAVARASSEQTEALLQYGTNLGLAFQIVDDLLDVAGDEAATGKRLGKDSERGKLTYPSLLGIEESRRRAELLIADACAAIQPFGPAAALLESLARFVQRRDR
ncbi:MAG: polyprenyl synthetase family protein [Planctomycetota bacterium]|nr:MAG: polyprenyl synthetase family protein [Planctomycetota bacterium]REJ94406.1 MAG: polyprenyl synthetase family protein [Planctomycetota bacterium]REK22061.1 MAG: polyprenyl synthetase family protein [Planctomycetota bacterium]REK44469.1 MAG: polyprenyl synthetase family protein [Planctomycetota bacterium]